MRSWDWWGKVSRRAFLRLTAAAASTLLLPLKALAQWPERTIFMVVGYAAGGGTDIIMRGSPNRWSACSDGPSTSRTARGP